MKRTVAELIAELIAVLRRAGVAVSVAEAMDAARAAALVGVERFPLRDALAATLVKDEDDRDLFLAAFTQVFPAAPPAAAVPKDRAPRRRSGGGDPGAKAGRTLGEAGAGADAASRRSEASALPSGEASRTDGPEGHASAEPRERMAAAARDAETAHDDSPTPGAGTQGGAELGGRAPTRRNGERRLRQTSFRAMTAVDVEDAAALARAIARRVTARVRRRLAPRPTGRLDFRRTIRAAVSRGGIPFERRYRHRRPGAPDLVALADLSASTATATQFFLALLAPATTYFRRVHLFGYVDRLVEIEFVAGQVRPAAPLDLTARSDFGRVLRDLVEGEGAILGADTVLLVLGDARNNRRPPRADLLAAARARVRRVLWLNPDPPERWNTGDSVIASYARHVDAVVACGTLAELERALAAVTTL